MRSLLLLAALLAAGLPASAATLVVRKGGSIREALARASPGDRIEVRPGVYREGAQGELNALTITQPGISLVGKPRAGEPVVLENAGGQSFGVWVSPANSAGPDAQKDPEHPPCGVSPGGTTLAGFSIRGFTIRGFEQHGVHLACVDGFSITDNHADANKVYGLFPIRSRRGVLAGNLVTNTDLDAAVYVGQSERVLIAGNVVRDNLLGIEVENSRNCSVIGNHASANSFGIFVDILPGLQKGTQEATLVAFNSVHGNNRDKPGNLGELLGFLPSGVGILMAGGHRTTVLMNDVRDNGLVGIAVASLCDALSEAECKALDVDPNPVDNRILSNRVVRNGQERKDPFLGPLGDLFWDGNGTGNCWEANVTSTPALLPSCH